MFLGCFIYKAQALQESKKALFQEIFPNFDLLPIRNPIQKTHNSIRNGIDYTMLEWGRILKMILPNYFSFQIRKLEPRERK